MKNWERNEFLKEKRNEIKISSKEIEEEMERWASAESLVFNLRELFADLLLQEIECW